MSSRVVGKRAVPAIRRERVLEYECTVSYLQQRANTRHRHPEQTDITKASTANTCSDSSARNKYAEGSSTGNTDLDSHTGNIHT